MLYKLSKEVVNDKIIAFTTSFHDIRFMISSKLKKSEFFGMQNMGILTRSLGKSSNQTSMNSDNSNSSSNTNRVLPSAPSREPSEAFAAHQRRVEQGPFNIFYLKILN